MKELTTPSPAAAEDWKDGIVHRLESPPVVAAPTVCPSCWKVPEFQMPSVSAPEPFHGTADVALPEYSEVPPTAVTSGWLAGSATARLLVSSPPGGEHSSEPWSPELANTDCPCAAISWYTVDSYWAPAWPISASHTP